MSWIGLKKGVLLLKMAVGLGLGLDYCERRNLHTMQIFVHFTQCRHCKKI